MCHEINLFLHITTNSYVSYDRDKCIEIINNFACREVTGIIFHSQNMSRVIRILSQSHCCGRNTVSVLINPSS